MNDWLNEAFNEAKKLDEQEKEWATRREEAGKAWRLKWPIACKECGGWGGKSFQQSHPYGSTTACETCFEPCGALPETVCHRCGNAGLDADGNGPCRGCGWDWGEDGDPSQ